MTSKTDYDAENSWAFGTLRLDISIRYDVSPKFSTLRVLCRFLLAVTCYRKKMGSVIFF